MVFSDSSFGYQWDINLRLSERSRASQAIVLSDFIAKAAREYDVFHFNFGSSLTMGLPRALRRLEGVDLPLLKRLGKAIVVTYQGCDARQRSFCEREFSISACDSAHCQSASCNAATDESKAKRVELFDRYADAIFALNPDLLHVLPERARFLPYTSADPREWTPRFPVNNVGPFTILHSPTDRGIKGTRYVIEAVETVKKMYPNVRLVLVEGLPHSEVRALYETADLVIDQLLVGWYGGFAVEAMLLGKPVVCYLREGDLGGIPSAMRKEMPIANANPENLATVLEELLGRRDLLAQRAVQSRAYAERWHDPAGVALFTKATYEHLTNVAARSGKLGDRDAPSLGEFLGRGQTRT